MMTALSDQWKSVKILIATSADANACDTHDYTALIHVAGSGRDGETSVRKRYCRKWKKDIDLTAIDVVELCFEDEAKLLREAAAEAEKEV